MLLKELRKQVKDSGVSQLEIQRRTGIAQPFLSRFMNDDGKGMNVRTVENILGALGLRVIVVVDDRKGKHNKSMKVGKKKA